MPPAAEAVLRPAIVLAAVEPLLIRVEDAADLAGLSRAKFYQALEAGLIGPEPIRFGKAIRFSLAELRAWAAAGAPPRSEWRRRGA